MRFLSIFILILPFVACLSKERKKVAEITITELKPLRITDSCLQNLYIDKSSVETKLFRDFWKETEKEGYTFRDDTIVPFVKVVFKPESADFYSDTLQIYDCSIFDSINIHRIEIQSTKAIEKKYYPNINVEELEFKDSILAKKYVRAMAPYLRTGYALKSPTAVMLVDKCVYIFETAAYIFIPELERMEKVLDPKGQVFGTNY